MRGRNPVALAGVIFPDEIADLAFIVDDQDVTVVQLRLPHIMVRPRRQIGGQVSRMGLKQPYHIWLQIVTQNPLP